MSKYMAKKVEYDGKIFDSKKELKRYKELLCDDEVTNLQQQVEYELIPKQKGKTKTERAVKYIADFVYERNGETVVEDVKGYRDSSAYRIFVIKRKLMLQRYGIEVQEI